LSKCPIGILISGRGSNMVSIIEAIQQNKLEADLKIVLSNNPDAPGLEKAKSLGIPVKAFKIKDFDDKEAYERALIAELSAAGIELVVLAGYMRVLGDSFISAFEHKILNIHPSLLPDFKGLHAQRQAVEAKVKTAGCTVHFVDNSLDGGPIIEQLSVDVSESDTEETLSQKILKKEHDLYPRTIQKVIEQRRRNG
jgi:phosphoribosylglycinamide formyltransferase 1